MEEGPCGVVIYISSKEIFNYIGSRERVPIPILDRPIISSARTGPSRSDFLRELFPIHIFNFKTSILNIFS